MTKKEKTIEKALPLIRRINETVFINEKTGEEVKENGEAKEIATFEYKNGKINYVYSQ